VYARARVAQEVPAARRRSCIEQHPAYRMGEQVDPREIGYCGSKSLIQVSCIVDSE
jgi:hypothetical protein